MARRRSRSTPRKKKFAPAKGLLLLLLLIGSAGLLALNLPRLKTFFAGSAPPVATQRTPSTPPAPRKPEPATLSRQPSSPAPATSAARPRLALVIDDMGYKEELGRTLIALDLDLTFAFLPAGPHTAKLAALARARNRDILLHLPMEPKDDRWRPEPGVLLATMPEKQIVASMKRHLAILPTAVGVNNHMGSKFTADPAAMRACLLLLRDRRLFFLDSLTAADSVAGRIAEEIGLPCRQRDIFLDHDPAPAAIAGQLRRLIDIARAQGAAVGIGHPRPETYAVLRDHRRLLTEGIDVVGVSRLIGKPFP
ncbi:MAG: divergent polysaccharide deacetylase family protein [Thermodesulfobacteriota bacterium]